MKTDRRRATQQGSALLIVLVFAAMIAILLYQELPVATFEAQREKEQLLIDRGNEYSRAVKLYVRKFQTFPPSLDALENTNRMRFLRYRYVDPYTGKADWRILHAGPGGIITDSKIKQAGTGPNGTAGVNGSSNSASALGAPSSVTNPFANSFDGSNPTGQTGPANNFPQRPPAIAVNGGGGGSGSNEIMPNMPQDAQQLDPQALAAALAAQSQADQSQAGQNPGVPYPGYPGPPMGGTGPQTGSSMPDSLNPMATASGQFPGRSRSSANPTGNSYPVGQFGGTAPTDPQSSMQSLLNTQNAPTALQNSPAGGSGTTGGGLFGSTAPTSSTGGSGTQMGAMSAAGAGGIAGVASTSAGHTIKIVNGQKDRSLWEFVYDMQKEAMANAPTMGNSGANGSGGNGMNSTNGSANQSSFGGGGINGSSGQSNSFFSNNNSQPNSPTSNQPAQSQNQ